MYMKPPESSMAESIPLRTREAEKNLDIYNNGRFDNTSVIQFKANSTKNNQKFRIDYHGNGLYTIS